MGGEHASRRMVVGFGANLGQPRSHFVAALRLLEQSWTIERLSSWYWSAPIGGPSQPWYLNAAILLRSDREPRILLQQLQDIERRFGRERRLRWGARTLDLDLLWVERVHCAAPLLTLPHPRLLLRAFALLPLTEVAPDACEPVAGRPYIKYLAPLQGQQIYRAERTDDSWCLRRAVAVCPRN